MRKSPQSRKKKMLNTSLLFACRGETHSDFLGSDIHQDMEQVGDMVFRIHSLLLMYQSTVTKLLGVGVLDH